MNTGEIEQALKSNVRTKRFFRGVYAYDEIPKVKRTNEKQFFVFNTDPSSKGGSHWVCAMINKKKGGKNVFFDSYGYAPRKAKFLSFLNSNYTYNKKTLQHPLSTTCGQWCIFFVWEKCYGKSISQITSKFDQKWPLVNDTIMNAIVQAVFKTKRKVMNKKFLKNQIARSMKENGMRKV